MSYKISQENSETPKDAWGRQLHLLNLLTAGQLMATQGEMLQNPYYVAQGCDTMLEVIGCMIKESVEVTTPEGKTKTIQLRGIETPTYKKYLSALTEIRELINYAMNNKVDNKNQLLSRAYQIGRALKAELLQKASDYELDFKSKPSVYDSWKE